MQVLGRVGPRKKPALPYPPPAIDRVRALIRIQRAYKELLAATGELAAIDAEFARAGKPQAQSLTPELVEAVFRPHLDRITGKFR